MNAAVLPFDPESLYQSITFNAEIKGVTHRLRVDLRHLTYTDKWYFSLYDAQTGKPYCLYVPLIASYVELNDLMKQFEHKEIGGMVCGAIVDKPNSTDPTEETIKEFAIVWGDSFDE